MPFIPTEKSLDFSTNLKQQYVINHFQQFI